MMRNNLARTRRIEGGRGRSESPVVICFTDSDPGEPIVYGMVTVCHPLHAPIDLHPQPGQSLEDFTAYVQSLGAQELLCLLGAGNG